MKDWTKQFRFYRQREDKSVETLAIVAVNSIGLKVAIPSQYIDLRNAAGDTFATITFPSWVKVREIGD